MSEIKNQEGRLEIVGTTPAISFLYTNYRGESSIRNVFPRTARFGTSEWHKEPQWLMAAWDIDRRVSREFAMKDMTDVVELPDEVERR